MEGMKMKFTVIKNEDIEGYMSKPEQEMLQILLEKLDTRKKLYSHANYKSYKPNKYLVINTDEEYAEEVASILKKNNHWG